MKLIGMILTLAIVIMAGIFVMKIVPVYIQRYSIHQSIQSLNRIPAEDLTSDRAANVRLLKEKLRNQLYINGIEMPSEKVKITPESKGGYQVSLKYKVVKPLISNMSLLFQFDIKKEVNPGG